MVYRNFTLPAVDSLDDLVAALCAPGARVSVRKAPTGTALPAGSSQADTGHQPLQLTSDELDAMFQYGFEALSVGDCHKAGNIFLTLCQADFFDPRNIYGLAATYHLQQDFDVAANLYAIAIGLRERWLEPHVRLAECLLGIGEFEEAAEILQLAETLAGPGDQGELAKVTALKMRIPQGLEVSI